ncbi:MULTISPECIES: Card1-like endonuclease domain-containing protein [unclassified Desulfovibrio]|uniref:Card1-like endonuclease domain-containing protein n=1 Tax=unclassified Desulfovibrio TaxID=2593640 RepID=UPI001639E059|nr:MULTISPECIES: DUF1887 family CARF protein [unclassified Desulfovibrio]
MGFPRMHHHIVFASGQPLPLVLGASIPKAQPACVHALVTEKMKQSGHNTVLKKALEGRECRYVEHALQGTDPEHIFSALDAVLKQCQEQTVGVNLNGGTKLMALAAAEWAAIHVLPTFYIDTEARRIVLPGSTWECLDLPDILDVRTLLAAYGYKIKRMEDNPVPRERREVLVDMLHLACKAPPVVRKLNGCAQQAFNSPKRMVKEQGENIPGWKEMLDLCQRAGMVQYGNGYVSFPSEGARKWCNGLWFEEFVHMTLYRMHCDKLIKSWASSVEVYKNRIRNELDAIFCRNNRLFLVECKTAFLGNKESLNSASPHLYNADSLRERLGGVFAKTMLCSVWPLEEYELERARALGVEVIFKDGLLQLEKTLLRWSSMT